MCFSGFWGLPSRCALYDWYVRLVDQEPAPSKCVLMSTSRAVRSAMRGWVVSDEGHRDLGGHFDTTFHGWSSTLASRVRLVIFSVGSCLCSPVGLSWAVRVLRSMFIPGALHGIEASFLAGTSMRKLRAAFFGVVWSCRQPFANIGAEGIWLIVLGRFLRFIDCWKVLLRVVLVMVLLIQSAAEIGFR